MFFYVLKHDLPKFIWKILVGWLNPLSLIRSFSDVLPDKVGHVSTVDVVRLRDVDDGG